MGKAPKPNPQSVKVHDSGIKSQNPTPNLYRYTMVQSHPKTKPQFVKVHHGSIKSQNQNRMGKKRRDETTAKTGAVAACHALRAASPLRLRNFSAGQLLRAVRGAARAALPAGIRHAMKVHHIPGALFVLLHKSAPKVHRYGGALLVLFRKKCTKSVPPRLCTFGVVSQKVHQKCTTTLVHFWCCFS